MVVVATEASKNYTRRSWTTTENNQLAFSSEHQQRLLGLSWSHILWRSPCHIWNKVRYRPRASAERPPAISIRGLNDQCAFMLQCSEMRFQLILGSLQAKDGTTKREVLLAEPVNGRRVASEQESSCILYINELKYLANDAPGISRICMTRARISILNSTSESQIDLWVMSVGLVMSQIWSYALFFF
jgi:hypothetical protein